jgi:hypothetical protein
MEQGALPRAIAADDRDSVTGPDSQRDSVEERTFSVGLRDLLDIDEISAGHA